MAPSRNDSTSSRHDPSTTETLASGAAMVNFASAIGNRRARHSGIAPTEISPAGPRPCAISAMAAAISAAASRAPPRHAASRLVQRHTATAPFGQADGEYVLKVAGGAMDGRLRQADAAGGLQEAARIGKGQKTIVAGQR